MYRPEHVAGVDEVGRGPLAGDVYAAAVILDPYHRIEGLRDSKLLSAKKRILLDEQIRAEAISFGIAWSSVAEIDEINILQASLLAMQRAVNNLKVRADFVIVDGNRTPDFYCPSEWLVKGDTKNDSIKAASIIAKVARDRDMEALDKKYPLYGFAQHKGYGTRRHMIALRKHGPCAIHRMSFAPCQQ